MKLNDYDRAELGRLIAKGMTSGRLDSEDKKWQCHLYLMGIKN